MVIMKLTAILNISAIGLLNIPTSVFAQGVTFKSAYQHMMTEGRTQTLTQCDIGRTWNRKGVSFWRIELVEIRKTELFNALRSEGHSSREVDNFFSGTSLAMNQLCPDVW
jgi:hypothetical protein